MCDLETTGIQYLARHRSPAERGDSIRSAINSRESCSHVVARGSVPTVGMLARKEHKYDNSLGRGGTVDGLASSFAVALEIVDFDFQT